MRPAALLAGLLLLLAAAPGNAAVRVAASVLPLVELAQRVGGGHVTVQALVGPGQNPHTFEPTARQLEGLTQAQLFWRVGMPFEAGWLQRLRAANPDLAVLDARTALGPPPAEVPAPDQRDGGQAHRHDDGPAHHHDPHVWTSPRAARLMVFQLAETLAQIDPDNAAAYRGNAATYAAELDALDAEIRNALAGLSQRRFLVYHPAWDEFAAAYGLEQLAIERDGKEPGARSLAALATAARRDGIRVIFVQPQTSPRSAQTLAAEIGARLVSADPLAADYAAGLRGLVRGLLEAQR